MDRKSRRFQVPEEHTNFLEIEDLAGHWGEIRGELVVIGYYKLCDNGCPSIATVLNTYQFVICFG